MSDPQETIESPEDTPAGRRALIAEIVAAMANLDYKLARYEGLLRTGRCGPDDYRNGLLFARQLKAHAAMLESLADDEDRVRDHQVRQYIRDFDHRAAIDRARNAALQGAA